MCATSAAACASFSDADCSLSFRNAALYELASKVSLPMYMSVVSCAISCCVIKFVGWDASARRNSFLWAACVCRTSVKCFCTKGKRADTSSTSSSTSHCANCHTSSKSDPRCVMHVRNFSSNASTAAGANNNLGNNSVAIFRQRPATVAYLLIASLEWRVIVQPAACS